MQGGEEAKHLAIAAVCGAALGAVAGALGYAALSTPTSSRRNSCASCLEQTSPKHASTLPSVSGSGESPMSEQDTAKLLEELGKRMESLEKAVRNKLLSKSGTNSSIAGYLTAQESPSTTDDDDDFQDVDVDSGSNEDIFFHTSATVKQNRARRDNSLRTDLNQPSNLVEPLHDSAALSDTASAVAISTPDDYSEIDRCLCSDLTADNSKAFEDLTLLLQDNPSLNSEAQFLWRYAKSVHQKNLASSDPDTKKVHAFRARELAFEALQCPGGDQSADVHKWCAITIGNIGDYVSVQEKIANGSEFKQRIDAAIRLNSTDEMSFYLMGRWCYSVYMMSWVERKVATSLVPHFPSTTIDEALVAFKNSEAIKPGHWIDNQLYLAKCYIEKRDYAAAMTWLDKALTLECKPEDRAIREEVEKLITKYSYYRES